MVSMFDAMGEVGSGLISYEDENGRERSTHSHRAEWELFAAQLSKSDRIRREVTWQEMADWILEEGFLRSHGPSLGEVLKEGIEVVQQGRTPKVVGQAVMILHSRTGLASLSRQEIAAILRGASGGAEVILDLPPADD